MTVFTFHSLSDIWYKSKSSGNHNKIYFRFEVYTFNIFIFFYIKVHAHSFINVSFCNFYLKEFGFYFFKDKLYECLKSIHIYTYYCIPALLFFMWIMLSYYKTNFTQFEKNNEGFLNVHVDFRRTQYLDHTCTNDWNNSSFVECSCVKKS